MTILAVALTLTIIATILVSKMWLTDLSNRIDLVARARYEEIENVADVVWGLVAHLDLSDDAVAKLVHEGRTSTRKTCPCDSCARWRVEHSDHSVRLDSHESAPNAGPDPASPAPRLTGCPFCKASPYFIVPLAMPNATEGDHWVCTACDSEWPMVQSDNVKPRIPS